MPIILHFSTQSYGNAIPAGKTFFNAKMLWSGSNAYFLRLPLHVSIITRKQPLFFSYAGKCNGPCPNFNFLGTLRLQLHPHRIWLLLLLRSSMADSIVPTKSSAL